MYRAIALLFALVASLSLLVACSTKEEPPKLRGAGEPNMIMVLMDDMHYSVPAKMPNVTNLLNNQGVEFTNATYTYPLCCPSRVTMFTGQYIHNHGVFDNRTPDTPGAIPDGGWERYEELKIDDRELACWLNSKYETALFGKYMNDYQDTTMPECWDRWYGWNGPLEGWSSVNNNGTSQKLGGQVADVTTGTAALNYINNYNKTDPLFMWASFGAPHEPYYYEPEWNDKFTLEQVPRSPAYLEDTPTEKADKPAWIRNETLGIETKTIDGKSVTYDEVAVLDRSYRQSLRSAQQVDKFVADLITTLQNKNMLSNTYIMFYNDNGDHYGEYGQFDGSPQDEVEDLGDGTQLIGGAGKSTPYLIDNESPLYIRGPGVTTNVNTAKLVGNQDIPVTIADIANITPPARVDGRSFLPLLTDPATATWTRQVLLSEKINPGRDAASIPHWRMVRTEDKVYIEWSTGEKEYYDLSTDPWQTESNPANAPTWMAPKLRDLAKCSGESCRVAENSTIP